MIEIAPELWPQGHCSSPMLAFLCKNLDCKHQSINQSNAHTVCFVACMTADSTEMTEDGCEECAGKYGPWQTDIHVWMIGEPGSNGRSVYECLCT